MAFQSSKNLGNSNTEKMSQESLSKKWKLAVKNNLYSGSFKDYAEMYNTFSDDNFFSDNSQNSTNVENTKDALSSNESKDAKLLIEESKVVLNKDSNVTKGDLKPNDMSKLDEPLIMGYNKTQIIIGVSLVIGASIGIYLLLNHKTEK